MCMDAFTFISNFKCFVPLKLLQYADCLFEKAYKNTNLKLLQIKVKN